MVYFYHYTNTAGKNAIVSSRMIKKSIATDRRDARYGEGVYGTNLSPEAGKRKIAQNNWDDNTQPTARMIRKAAWAIKINIPDGELKEASSTRDILIYPGDLHLDRYTWEVIEV